MPCQADNSSLYGRSFYGAFVLQGFKIGERRPVKTVPQCKYYIANRAKISRPLAHSCDAERLLNNASQPVGILLDDLLLLAFDHDARQRFSPRITQQQPPALAQ